MENRFLKLPLRLEQVFNRKDLDACSLEESVDQHICLILSTQFGESRYDETFGSEIWEIDFSIIPSVSIWTDRLARSIASSLQDHENRLFNIIVRVEVGETVDIIPEKGSVRLRKKIILTTSGFLSETREPKEFKHELFLSPVSLD